MFYNLETSSICAGYLFGQYDHYITRHSLLNRYFAAFTYYVVRVKPFRRRCPKTIRIEKFIRLKKKLCVCETYIRLSRNGENYIMIRRLNKSTITYSEMQPDDLCSPYVDYACEKLARERFHYREPIWHRINMRFAVNHFQIKFEAKTYLNSIKKESINFMRAGRGDLYRFANVSDLKSIIFEKKEDYELS